MSSSNHSGQAPDEPIRPALRRHTGESLEGRAACFLADKGLILIERNYRCRLGEIDLIMQDGDYLVFVEVRYRTDDQFVNPIASINFRKQQKVLRTAQVYLQHHQLTDKVPCRIDVIGITRTNDSNALHYKWIRNAIQA